MPFFSIFSSVFLVFFHCPLPFHLFPFPFFFLILLFSFSNRFSFIGVEVKIVACCFFRPCLVFITGVFSGNLIKSCNVVLIWFGVPGTGGTKSGSESSGTTNWLDILRAGESICFEVLGTGEGISFDVLGIVLMRFIAILDCNGLWLENLCSEKIFFGEYLRI